ncbi:NADPH-dependent F420 reductase [Paenibacillus sp.]|uniref:NADPH-dependent F420 reductase n=1 Tax=Paenibacillus sp. TaxID=58172 RepID=UPI002D606CB5|nr:NADPH-dependent F420 reductase [Paenibacillus sp.]HZG84241.1 NADPH-dependent F420 reductase [Paenibacillus sp.]
MKVSVIGTGRMGSRLARALSQSSGKEVLWGSREPERARRLAEEMELSGVRAVDPREALEADVVVHALWFRDVLPWAEAHRDALAGKIVVDIVNPFNDDFDDYTLPWGASAAEELQRALPQSRVVGAFKNTFWTVFDKPVHEGLTSDVYVTSDDEAARRTVLELLRGLPFRALDAGALRNNRTIERMTLFEREMAIRHGHPGYVSFRLFGVPG